MDEFPAPFRYQDYVRQKIIALKRTAVIAPPGSGKTRPIVGAVNELGGFQDLVLIICSGSAVPTWRRQIPLWSRTPEYAESIFLVQNEPHKRMALWKSARDLGRGIYICNASVFYRDWEIIREIPWRTVISDEYHKFMRSHKVHVKMKDGRSRLKTYGKFKSMTLHTEIVILATGSIVRRNAASMFTAFQICRPKIFRSYWKFVNTYCHIDDEGFGQRVYGVKNAKQLRDLMDRYFAYVPPEVAADELPEGRRFPIPVDLTKEQLRIYKELDEDMLSLVGDTLIMTPTILGKLVKLRQLICCPRILDKSLGMGAGFEAIHDRMDTDDHIVIFVPFRPACDFIAEELLRLGYKNVFIMRGGVGPDEQAEITEQFRQTRGQMVCTIAYAESFDLETCKTSYFLGYDLTADQNEQAEGRTRRAISEHEFVTWGYIKTDTAVDGHFLAKLGEDSRNTTLILQRPESYIRMLKGEQT